METYVPERSSEPEGRGGAPTPQPAQGGAFEPESPAAARGTEEELRRLNRTLSAHSKSNQAMMRAVDEGLYLQEVCGIITEDCGHAMVWIGFAENDPEQSVRPAACAGFEEGYLDALNVTWADRERGRGPTGTAIRTGKPCGCRNMLTDPEFAPWREEAIRRGYASSMVLPLMAGDRAFGAINIYSRGSDAFSDEEVRLLEGLADDLAHGIQALRLREAHGRAEAALRESEERFRSAFEDGAIPMALTALDGTLLKVNSAFCRLLGYSEAEMVGRTFVELTHPDDLLENRAGVDAVVRGEEPTFRIEKRYFRKDGRIVWGDMSTAAVRGSRGAPLYLVTHVQDITERKAAEEALRQSREQLEALYDREHHIAHMLQKSLIPDPECRIPSCAFTVRYEAALQEAEVGGDFYDFFELDGGRVGVLIGDVAGKGLDAAVQVAAARHSFRCYAYLEPLPERVMTLANNALCRDQAGAPTMLTAFFAVLDPRSGSLRCASGGHVAPIILRAGGAVEELPAVGRAMGIRAGYDYRPCTAALDKGDLLVLLTDGIIEARSTGRSLFGMDGLRSFLAEHRGLSAPDLADALLDEAKRHAGGALRDDAVIMIVERSSAA